jgi:hypothetical protein
MYGGDAKVSLGLQRTRLVEEGLNPLLPLLVEVLVGDDVVVLHHLS